MDILMKKLLIWDKREIASPGQVIIPDIYVCSYTTYRCACYMSRSSIVLFLHRFIDHYLCH